ncbi:MAG: UDP-N-acetylmuramoyl-tripeptide--D-alanyl-D-alanine ligase [Phycisphaerae bacterium]|nr:UDP-N-acetylmuramoyl-tripeptide--D-alanyl-D-alanine ligase [Phycisphaerae bacterium]
MNLIGIDQVAEAVGGRVLGPPEFAHQTVGRVSTDSRAVQGGDLFVAIKGANFDGHRFVATALAGGATGAIVSQPMELPTVANGRPVGLIVVSDTVSALGKLAAWYRGRLPATVIAITGSNGKTTTKNMVEHMLSRDRRLVASPKSYNNNIGLPLTLLSADASHDVVVCEVGSNAPGEIAGLGAICRPDIGVIVSVSETHLEKLKSLDGVAAEKASLLGQLAPGGVGIINCCPPPLQAAVKNYPANLIRFGTDAGADLVMSDVVTTPDSVTFTVNGADRVTLPVLGRHNASNALAAIAVGRRMGLSVAEAAGRLSDFVPPPMRLQPVKVGSIQFINDAYNANPESMRAALDVFKEILPKRGRKVFICGDMLEQGPASEAFHAAIGEHAAKAGVARLIAVGQFAYAVVRGACKAGLATSAATQFDSTESLLESVAGLLAPGDVVLLKGSRGMAMERVIERLQRAGGQK